MVIAVFNLSVCVFTYVLLCVHLFQVHIYEYEDWMLALGTFFDFFPTFEIEFGVP